MMKIAIIGAGAMGSLFGGKMAAAADVCLYDVNKAHIDAVKEKGLLMSQGDKETYVKMRATTDPKEIGIVDVALFFTKYTFMHSAAKDALNCIGPDTIVITLQNGLGCPDLLKEYVSEDQICYGLTSYTSDFKGPGHIELTTTSSVGTWFWPLNGKVTEKQKELERTMCDAGFDVTITKDVNKMIWRKLIINCNYNPLAGLTQMSTGDLFYNPNTYEIIKNVCFEICDVAQAKGIDLPREEGLAYLKHIADSVYDHVASMGLDVANKRMTEITVLNEAVAAEGARLGVPTPTVKMLANLIRALESQYKK